MAKNHPFDRSLEDGCLFEIALDTDSLHNDLLAQGSPAVKLTDLVGIRGLRLFALPSNNPNIVSILANKQVPLCKFHEKPGLPLLRTGDSTELIYETDLLIARPKNQHRTSPKALWILEPESALELIRLLLVGKGVFEVFPGYHIDETLHYIYRFKKLFPLFQTAWSVAVATNQRGLPSGVFEQLDSLNQRGQFLCRAPDSVMFHALRPPTSYSQTATLYHLAYFVILATGLFDDLAWLANHAYNLRLDKRELGLRKKEFQQALESKNQRLKQYLSEPEADNGIALFYPLRDQIQHRMFLKAKRVVERNLGRDENRFELPADTFVHVKNLVGRKGCQKWGIHTLGSEQLFEARQFVACTLSIIAEIHNHFMERIDWVAFLDRSAGPLRKEVTAQIQRFRSGVWRFLNFPREPVYF